MLVEELEVLQSIQETYVAMNEAAGPKKLDVKKILAKYPELADYGLKTAVWFNGELHTTSDHSIAPAGISDEKICAAAGMKVNENIDQVDEGFMSSTGAGTRPADLSKISTETLTKTHAMHSNEPKGTRSYEQRQRVAAELKKRGVKVPVDEGFAHPNHKKLDANGNGKVDAHDFELLRKKKGMKNFKEFKESLEQLDELSKKTLSSYVKNANTSAINTGMEVGFHTGSGGKSDSKFKQDQMDKLSKRQKGIHTAINKLTKEDIDALGLDEEQLDELSKKTLGSYITKASMNRGHHGIDVGHYPLDSPKQVHHMNQMKKRQAGVKAAVRKLTKEDIDALGLDLDELM